MLSATPWITIDSGYIASRCAPARYSGTCGPGTLEIVTFDTRSRAASRERPYSETSPDSSQGEPSDGKSLGIRPPMLPICAFIARVARTIASSRASGSAIALPSSTSAPETWLLAVASPSARTEIGTNATSGAAGSSRASARYARSAVEHSHSTMSLTDAPCALPSALTSASGSDAPANARWLVIDALKGVGGASGQRSADSTVPTPASPPARGYKSLHLGIDNYTRTSNNSAVS